MIRNRNLIGVASLGLVIAIMGGLGSGSALAAAPGSDATAGPDQEQITTACEFAPKEESYTTVVVPEAEGSKRIVEASVRTLEFNGNVMEQRFPPDGWTPATASPEELDYFGIDRKPNAEDREALADWEYEWIDNYTGFMKIEPCVPLEGAYATDFAKLNWSGAVARAGSYTKMYGQTVYKTGSSCSGGNDSYANWVGLGGHSSSKLLQNGFYVLNGTSGAFWEGLNSTHTPPIQPMYLTGLALGHRVRISTEYDAGWVYFSWHDLDVTSGSGVAVAAMSTIDGAAVSTYYDGSSAEAVDERITVLDTSSGTKYATKLRNYGTDAWDKLQVQVNGGSYRPLRGETPHDGYLMYSPGYASGSSPISYPTSGSTTQKVTDTWVSCGSVDYY